MFVCRAIVRPPGLRGVRHGGDSCNDPEGGLSLLRGPAAADASILQVPLRLGYAILYVSDLDRSVAFYRDALGLPLRFQAEEYAEFETEDAKFALFPRSALPKLIGRKVPAGPIPCPRARSPSSATTLTPSAIGCAPPGSMC
jgi:hypothetical protein